MDPSRDDSEDIKEINDADDMEKPKINECSRQVMFQLPTESQSSVSAALVKSLDSGLCRTKGQRLKNKTKKYYNKRQKSPAADTISWPSDSDITVLRMKVCLTQSDKKLNFGNLLPGDGLHRSDSSSMVNLATVIRQTKELSPSNDNPKQLQNGEECLMQLTSWEETQSVDFKESLEQIVEPPATVCENLKLDFCTPFRVLQRSFDGYVSSKDSGVFSRADTKSKVARFLRLYFCPCCSCLYKMETMGDKKASYVNGPVQRNERTYCRISS